MTISSSKSKVGNKFNHTINSDPAWSINNPYLSLLSSRFFSDGNTVNWRDLPLRVGRLFFKAESKYSSNDLSMQRAVEISELVHEGIFLPNSPVMMNSEHEECVNLFACHVLSPPTTENDLDIAKQIHDGCGGIGYDFSNLSDPVSATLAIEKETHLLNPLRKRKAHSAVTLNYSHQKVLDFINISPQLVITHTNVEFDDLFFESVSKHDVAALSLWSSLCESIYKTGRPSLSFISQKQKRSSSKLINNVCGESLLRENESSLIGSINLTKFVDACAFDFDRFERVARLGLRCLDNLHDIQEHASHIVRERCMESRKVGIGVMGYSDCLLLLGIRYGSKESLDFVDRLMSLLQKTLLDESQQLGAERGFCDIRLLQKDDLPRRNVSLMAIPANGTLSLIANVSGGIEPVFSYLTKQKVQDHIVHQLQPTFKNLLDKKDIDQSIIYQYLLSGRALQQTELIDEAFKNVLVTANELSTEEHIYTQAKFQSYIDGGISKTINLPYSATMHDIEKAILLAVKEGCVGISLYRNGSIQNQPTQTAG